MNTLYWHDYETWGTDPRRSRASQFAGVRTDEDLNIIGEPLMLYCAPADDLLPEPEACLITGITPQKAQQEGVCEAEFIRRIEAELGRAGTCGVGYNSIRFDDEFTRYTLYRNFYDPYAREWQNGNSRWDLLDVVRLTYALRPDGIEWPTHEDGRPSFKLEHLTEANGLSHQDAHDALSDVHATIAVARLIKKRQPRLFQYAYDHRFKARLAALLDPTHPRPVLHTSGMYSTDYGCTALVYPLARHPQNPNGVIVYDLRYDPTPLLEMEIEALQELLYLPAAERTDDMPRIPLKTVHVNKAPVVVPAGTLRKENAQRLQMDLEQHRAHLRALQAAGDLSARVQAIMGGRDFVPDTDPDAALYSGGFFSDADRERMIRVRATPPEELARLQPAFEDRRLPEMLFRYRARNWPQTLAEEEHRQWQTYRRMRLTDPEGGGSLTLDELLQRLDALRGREDILGTELVILDELEAYARQLEASLEQAAVL